MNPQTDRETTMTKPISKESSLNHPFAQQESWHHSVSYCDVPAEMLQTTWSDETLDHPDQSPEQLIAELEQTVSSYRQREQRLRSRIARLNSALQGKSEALLQAESTLLCHQMDMLEQRTREMTLLSAMGDDLLTCTRVEDVYTIAQRYGQRLFAQHTGVLYLVSQTSSQVEPVAHWGAGDDAQPLWRKACCALRHNRMHIRMRHDDQPTCKHCDSTLPVPVVCIPLHAHGAMIGILHLHGGPATPQETFEHWLGLAIMVAQRLAMALANLQLREQLLHQSLRDPLTGLFNRRYLAMKLDEEIQKACQNDTPIGVMMLDIDHFKAFNDTYGHEAGDALLVALGEFLLSRVRGKDTACRYGGEEFLLILPGATLADTRRRAEELRQGLRQLRLPEPYDSLERPTLSLGIASFPLHAKTARTLVASADEALYGAKAAGRDCVVVAG
jgi:diguanylate cyclase (GGDEF)-like protein